jgi:putative ABC transport system permease protein
VSGRLFRFVLGLLPGGFRRRYGAEIEADFEAARADARARRGRVGETVAVTRALGDVLVRAPIEHWKEPRVAQLTWRAVRACACEARAAATGFRRRPGFAALSLGALALGMAATTMTFTVVNGVLIRPLPFPESDRVVAIEHHAPGLGLPEMASSLGTIRFYSDRARTLAGVALVDHASRNLSGPERPDRVRALVVSPSFFRVIETEPELGRSFRDEDAREGAEPMAILTFGAWTTRFAADESIVGRTVRIDGVTTRIIGVMPKTFRYDDPETVLLLPREIPAGLEPMEGNFGRNAIARLAPGMSIDDARTEIEALQAQLGEGDPELTPAFFEKAGWSVTVRPVKDKIVGDVRAVLWVVLGTVAFVLGIAWANVANLFLVRAEGRHRELAVRSALGAARARLALAILCESLLLAVAACAIGLVCAAVGVRALLEFAPPGLPRLDEIGIDAAVISFALAVAVASGLLLGALVVARQLGMALVTRIREGGRSMTHGRERGRTRNVLAAAQLSLALVLLIGSGLMVRSALRLRAVDPGLDPKGLTAVHISLGDAAGRAEALSFYRRLITELRGTAEIASAAGTNTLPMGRGSMNGGSFEIESRPHSQDVLVPVAMWMAASDGFFETAGIPVLEGRTMTPADADGPGTAVWVNQTFASEFLQGGALGERIQIGGDHRWWQVAGVVGDVRLTALSDPVKPLVYYPLADSLPAILELQSLALLIRGSAPEAEQVDAVRAVVQRLSADVPVTQAESMEQVVARSMASTSFTVILLSISAMIALLLGTVGVYGVLAYAVSQRTREIGVRMALGAGADEVQRWVVRQGASVIGVGLAVGLIGALALTRLLRSLLYEVSATDPVVFLTVPALLACVALAATWIPARRASRIDPKQALVSE